MVGLGGLNSVFNGRSYGTQGLAPATFAFSATAETYFDVRAETNEPEFKRPT